MFYANVVATAKGTASVERLHNNLEEQFGAAQLQIYGKENT